MTARVLFACSLVTVAIGFAVERHSFAQSGLDVSFGSSGLQRIAYNGQVLEDTQAFTADAFHIWHMKVTDLNGNVQADSGWGETNQGRDWNSATKTWTYHFAWGTLALQYQVQGTQLNMVVTETNRAGSGVILDGASIYPLALHFPSLPTGFLDSSYPQLSYNTTGPSVLPAVFGSSMVVAVAPDAQKPLYSGFLPNGTANTYTALVSSTTPDGLATFQPHLDRPVLPGQIDQFTVSLRFAPAATPLASLAQDAYASWAATWPAQLAWNDRRIIGTAYLASSPTGDVHQAGGYPNNPRRYFNDSNASDFDVTTPDGLVKFQQRVLAGAQSTVQNLQRLNAQGLITWDIEGEQFPQDTSYVCSPDQIATVAPEMESVVSRETGSAFAGMKLDDAYFKTIRDAGFRVGVCVRPQHFTLAADGTASQVTLPDSEVVAELTRKMKFAHDRWGATLFYADSTVEANGAVLDASLFQQAAAAFKDSLLIPEETTPKYYAYTAPFKSFLFHGDLGTDSSVLNYYPKAFSANLINDVDPTKLAAAVPALVNSVRNGDVLMVHADYWQDNNTVVQQIYAAARAATSGATTGSAGSATTPPGTSTATDSSSTSTAGTDSSTQGSAATSDGQPPSTAAATTSAPASTATSTAAAGAPVVANSAVAISAPATGQNVSGVITVEAQIAATLDAAGSFLMVDGTEIGTRRVSSAPFSYALDTSALSDGPHTLQVWAHSSSNDALLSGTVTVTVANQAVAATTQQAAAASASVVPTSTGGVASAAAPAQTGPVQVAFPLAGQAIHGVVTVLAAITHGLDAAGSYLMIDGQEVGSSRLYAAPFAYVLDSSTLSAGAHVLQVWAHDTNNDTLISEPVAITVTH